MHLLRALHQFSLRQVRPAEEQYGTALENACQAYQNPAVSSNVGEERITSIVQMIRDGAVSALNHRDLRHAMSAVGTTSRIDADAIRSCLSEIDRRRDGRLVSAAFKALLACYRNKDICAILRNFCANNLNMLRSNLQEFARWSGILIGDGELETIAQRLVGSRDGCRFSVEHGLTANILMSNYGLELKLAAIRNAVALEDVSTIHRILDWSFEKEHGIPLGDFYEAMLLRFESQTPPAQVQKLLLSKAVEQYGDPRIHEWPGLTGIDGHARRERCRSTIKRWLSIEYLDLFIEIIEETAVDRQFSPRKSFWLKYFEADLILDITLVLASDADKVARKAQQRMDHAEYMQWSTLNGALSNQSVLLMRIGDLIIAEWSHSGAIRFWDVDNHSAPHFHMKSYYGHTLRNNSLTVKVGGKLRDSIIHHENGQWMRWAGQVIEYHTGIKV
jgi:hypothetical protein